MTSLVSLVYVVIGVAIFYVVVAVAGFLIDILILRSDLGTGKLIAQQEEIIELLKGIADKVSPDSKPVEQMTLGSETPLEKKQAGPGRQ